MSKATHILLVDDDPDIVKIFSEVLRSDGYEVWEASTGAEALEMTRRRHPELVLLDVHLPDLSGTEVCRQLKADPTLPDVFVVLFSGEATTPEHAVSGLETGADEYMSKSLDWDEFRARLRTLVRLRDVTAALRASEHHYRQLVEILPDAVGVLDLHGRMVAANPQAARMLGYDSPEELLQKGVFELTTPEQHQRLRATLAATLAQGTTRNTEYTLRKKDGTAFPVELSAAVLRSSQGLPLGVVTVTRDIAERKQAEAQLREAEAQYRSVFEQATEGIFRTTLEGRLLSANPALSRMFGYSSPEEMISVLTDIARQLYVHPAIREELKKLLLTQGSIEGFEVENYRKNGTRFWVSLNLHLVRDATGAIVCLEGTIHDITERRLAQQRLAEAMELNRKLLDNIPDPAWLKDADGRFLAGNGALARFFGRPLEQIMGKTIVDLRPAEAARLARDDNVVKRTGKPVVAEESTFQPSGQLRWFEVVKSPILNDSKEVTGIVSIARDVTERKWAENLLTVQRDFGIFLSSTEDLAAAAGGLLKAVLRTEGLDCGAVHLVEPDDGTLVLAAYEGLSAAFGKRAIRFAAKPVHGSARRTAPLAGIVHELRREGLKSLEALPLHHSGQIVAVLSLGSHLHREIPDRTRRMTDAIATQAGGAIARIRAEQSLLAQRELLEKTLHSLRSAVFIVDAHTGVIQECNPAATLIFGYRRDEIIGRTTAFLHLEPALFEQFRAQVRAAFKGKGFVEDLEFAMRRKNGAEFPTSHTVMPIRNERGRLVNWVSNVREISERKKAEAELRRLPHRIIEAQEAERLRVARELHDGVNQIIASVKMRLRKVQDLSVALGPAAREIISRCDKLLVQALEENRRIAHNLRPSVLDELGLASACRNLCRELQARSRLTVKCSIAKLDHRFPQMVELNLFRIVQEALNNIEKHARARTIHLRLAEKRGSVQVTIQDDGRGFETEGPRKRKGDGHGLGLTNMRERASAMGGTLEVKTVRQQGTTITIRVPCPEPKKADTSGIGAN